MGTKPPAQPMTFASAAEAQRLGIAPARLITAQPGYHRGQTMILAKAATGGVRLFVAVSCQWMDGSLADIESPAAALGRRGGKIGGKAATAAKQAAARANGAKGGRPRKQEPQK